MSTSARDGRLAGRPHLRQRRRGRALVAAHAAGIALDGGKGCVWRSEDGGLNWNSIGTSLPVHGVYDLRQDPNDRRRLVVATTSGVWQALLPSDRIFDDRENLARHEGGVVRHRQRGALRGASHDERMRAVRPEMCQAVGRELSATDDGSRMRPCRRRS